ncbi:MAG: hypothetical protein HGA78_03710 [Nitrospirales bacterium]|nr:hypothetical protein [Nitrospirales bacterium]
MISQREFIRTFQGLGFGQRELKLFYTSVRKSVILASMGKGLLTELFSLEEKCQWPILQAIDDPDLPIYKGADKALLRSFIAGIKKEKELRTQKKIMDKVRYWTALRSVIEERTELFKRIFDFSRKDMRHCDLVAERYKGFLERRRNRRMWQIGIGAGAATLAGSAAYLYFSRKKK